ncbi:hypothetical protein QBC43DRAFT_287954 [Cladorrhinum sp. PSN259]|nr:hypothetical protein QBC43DRAFT_287954 [Cladorrhinum sp. PSN259]
MASSSVKAARNSGTLIPMAHPVVETPPPPIHSKKPSTGVAKSQHDAQAAAVAGEIGEEGPHGTKDSQSQPIQRRSAWRKFLPTDIIQHAPSSADTPKVTAAPDRDGNANEAKTEKKAARLVVHSMAFLDKASANLSDPVDSSNTVDTKLAVLVNPSSPQHPSVYTSFDIVAVHDITQLSETAWATRPEGEVPQGKTNAVQEQVPSMTGALTQSAGFLTVNPNGAQTSGENSVPKPLALAGSSKANMASNKGKNSDTAAVTTQTTSPTEAGTAARLVEPVCHAGRARVMAFGYEPPGFPPPVLSEADGVKYDEYLTNVSKALVERLSECRNGGSYDTKPVVFIATGFGCLIMQRAISLIAAPQDNTKWQTILNMAAGVLFLDATMPLPKKKPKKEGSKKEERNMDSNKEAVNNSDKTREERGDEQKKEPELPKNIFPKSANRNSRWVKALLVPRHIDSGRVWESFQATAGGSGLHVAWFYDPTLSKAQPSVDGVLFVPLTSPVNKSNCSLTLPLRGPKDSNYSPLIEQLRHCIFFKASSDVNLEGLLVELISKAPLLAPAAKDIQSHCPAHLAAFKANAPALELLITAYPPLAEYQDNERETPLHVAIKGAASISSDDSQKPAFRRIIEKLLDAIAELGASSESQDQDGKSPWDYLDSEDSKHNWIRKLRNSDRLITAKATQQHAVPQPVPPNDSDKLAACKKLKATLVQFYIATDGTADYTNEQRPTMHEVLYDDSYGPEKLFGRNLRHYEDKKPTCRWIHLPANNEEWAQAGLGFVSSTQAGRRVAGRETTPSTAKFDRHINADAQRYKQVGVPDPSDEFLSKADQNEIYQPVSKGGQDVSPLPSINLPSEMGDTEQGDFSPTNGSAQNANIQGRPKLDRSPSSSSSIGSTEQQLGKRLTYAVFMPILGFEKHKHLKSLKTAMRKPKYPSAPDDTTMLVRGYFQDASPLLHCRRTLDQFTYHMLQDTEKRDNTQVIYKWARRQPKKPKPVPGSSDEDEYPVLMIDQLWLWVLEDEQTVITCFPDTWESDSPYNLLRHFLKNRIKTINNRQVIECAMDLANEIIRRSVDFLPRKRPMELSLQGCFQSSINAVAESQARRFEIFRNLIKQLARKRKEMGNTKQASLTDKLFRLTKETDLLVEILDIQDELKIIRDVMAKQQEVLRKLHPMVPTYAEKKTEEDTSHQPSESAGLIAPLAGVRSSPGKAKTRLNVHFADQGVSRKESKTRQQAKDNLALVDANIDAVVEMTQYADKMRVELNGLLDLKQKQANAWEARFSREGSESSQRQGNITMVFTIVTIFFLPLSFVSSVLAI